MNLRSLNRNNLNHNRGSDNCWSSRNQDNLNHNQDSNLLVETVEMRTDSSCCYISYCNSVAKIKEESYSIIELVYSILFVALNLDLKKL